MSVRNMMEDIVGSALEEVLSKEKNKCTFDNCKEDILAYVLNRVPPKYITSERGILHTELNSRFLFQEKSDILFLIHEAIECISKRRDNNTSDMQNFIENSNLFFPHLLGEVMEETTFSIIPDVEITLLINDKPAKMMDKNWENPYKTNRAIKGYYHFWPSVEDASYKKDDKVDFRILFKHPKFQDFERKITIDIYDTYRLNRTVTVPITLLKLKNGEDASFLYE